MTRAYAYLVAVVYIDGPQRGAVRDVAVYSEARPTLSGRDLDSIVLGQAAAPTYGDADALLRDLAARAGWDLSW